MAPLPDNDKTADPSKQDKNEAPNAKEQPHDVKCNPQDSGGEVQHAIDKPPQASKDNFEASECQNFAAKSDDPRGKVEDAQDSEGESQDANDQYQDAKDQFQDTEEKPHDYKEQWQYCESQSQDSEAESPDAKEQFQDSEDVNYQCGHSDEPQDSLVKSPDAEPEVSFDILRFIEVADSEDELQDYPVKPQHSRDALEESLGGKPLDAKVELQESEAQNSANKFQEPLTKTLHARHSQAKSADGEHKLGFDIFKFIELQDCEEELLDYKLPDEASKVQSVSDVKPLELKDSNFESQYVKEQYENSEAKRQYFQETSGALQHKPQDVKDQLELNISRFNEVEDSEDELQAKPPRRSVSQRPKFKQSQGASLQAKNEEPEPLHTKNQLPDVWNWSVNDEDEPDKEQRPDLEAHPEESEANLQVGVEMAREYKEALQPCGNTLQSEKGQLKDSEVKSQAAEGELQDVKDMPQSSEDKSLAIESKCQKSQDIENSKARKLQKSEVELEDSEDLSQGPSGHSQETREQYQDYDEDSEEEEIVVTHLNDKELKSLLDEAMSYKNPTDRQGKSELFNDLLKIAEREESDCQAAKAVGSAKVRHYNPEKLKDGNVKKSGSHGGSLDNLSNKDNYDGGGSRTNNSKKNKVSARRREGGSLPNDVNDPGTGDFLSEAKQQERMKNKDCPATAKERIPQDDPSARGYEERLIDGGETSQGSSLTERHLVSTTANYTISALGASNVDDPLVLTDLDNPAGEKKLMDGSMISKVIQPNKSLISLKTGGIEERKVDENGNALQQKEKKKKKQNDKNVVVVKSENIQGHKSEIIDNVDELLNYIEGTSDNIKSRTVQSKSKQLHKQHASEDGGSKSGKKKQLKSVGKDSDSNIEADGRPELKKSNSLGEISGMKFDSFNNNKNKQEKDKENVALRGSKATVDRTRERRSWGNVEALYNASSLEHLETSTDNWEVTRPKKKSKKRRNSLSGASGARQNSSASGVSSTVSNEDRRSRRAHSPDLGVVRVGGSNAKTTRSMPHSEKSNDSSSDVDSVRSLPLDGPISYADIAKNIEKKKPSPEKQERPAPVTTKEKTPQPQKSAEADLRNSSSSYVAPQVPVPVEKSAIAPNKDSLSRSSSISKSVVPDVHNIKSFPAITGSATKTSNVPVTTLANPQTQSVTTSDKAVQSTLSYDDSFVREIAPSSLKKTASVQNLPVELAPTGAAQPVRTVPPPSSKRPNPPHSASKERRNKGMPKEHVSQGHGDAHNELPLMKDPTHYASQRMPPDIMDVSTIEKMQLLNYSSSSISTNTANSSCNNSTPQVSCTNNASKTLSTSNVASTLSETGANQGTSKGKRKKGGGNNNNYNNNNNTISKALGSDAARNVVNENVSSVCDNSSEEIGVSSNIINGVTDDTKVTSPDLHQSDAVRTALSSNDPPPVVILSGQSKEVPSGLVFGFDVNEQLLLEDSECGDEAPNQQQPMPNSTVILSGQNASENNITNINIRRLPNRCDEWAKLFRPPANEKNHPKHNHDKIVNFVAMAWESVLNQQIPYYSDSL